MTVLQLLENITLKQIELILKEYQAMPSSDYSKAIAKARTAACRNRKPTWTLFSLAYVNALLIGFRKLKFNQSYDIIKMLSAVECFAYGVIAQASLTFEEFNLAIGPVASVLSPELFAEEQSWEIEPILESEFSIPYRPPSYRVRRPKKTDQDNLVELVDNLVREAMADAAVRPASVRPVESTADDAAALEIMLGASRNP